ncbi:hypothetical protein IFM89_025592 [Coptis chinensis]|uniref:Transmembrane protein n=1 Tax=Coptis chinensis TaxID=261450 RepID=A0A835HGX6_9MAGN|nr:hypothetical protein IFM89_025592 [Coptis chinensis]
MTHRPRLNLRTTTQLINQSTSTFTSNFFTFLFLSLLLLSFKTIVENGTLIVTTFIDHDPSLKSLLSKLDLSGTTTQQQHHNIIPPPHNHRGRNRPFLHLTRVGTLDDDFFSTDDDRRGYLHRKKSVVNTSFVNLSYLDGKKFEGIKFMVDDYRGGKEKAGIELARRDAATLFFLVSFLSAGYGWLILGYLVMQSCVLGIVFIVVVNNYLRKYSSFFGNVLRGSDLGFKRLSGFILIRWAVRDALTQFLGLWFFGEVEDQYSFLKLFVRLKLMPFAVSSPWIPGFEKEVSGFRVAWVMVDACVSFVFAVNSWVAIMDYRMSSREVVKEGCYLISMMANQAVVLKWFEVILSGTPVRWVVSRIFGRLFGSFFQSVVEVYFMVVWLIYYFAVRCKDVNSDGRRFGRRDLEHFINRLRY